MRTLALLHFTLACSAFAALQAPSALTVTSATNRQVKLSWTAGGSDANQYVVERRVLDNGTFAAIGTVVPDLNKVLATAYIDAAFDPFTAYIYRVRAVNTTPLPSDISDPTNEVTVGPPPYGYTRVVSTPDKLSFESDFGRDTQMELDPSGDPVLAYLVVDPNDDGNDIDSDLRVVRWDRAHYTWTKPVTAGVVGSIGSAAPATEMRLAVDSSTGAIEVVYIDATDPSIFRITLVDSTDGGVTWRKRTVVSDPQNGYRFPSIAAGGGKIYLSFYHDFDGIRYVNGKLADDPTTWSSELAPLAGGTYYLDDSDVALDSAGNPGVAYVTTGDDGHREVFYRPGSAAAVANLSVNGPGDFWQVRLRFSGTNPRIAFLGMMDELYFYDYDHTIFLLVSNDGGATWNSRMNIVSDGHTSLSGPIDLSFDSKGRGAIAADVGGGNSDGVICGEPKLALSDESLKFKMCGITATLTTGFASPNVRFVANDTMYMGFQAPHYPFDAASPLEIAAGVYFWRGPIGFTFPTPPPQQ